MRSWTTFAGGLAPEPAVVPFGLVVRHQSKLGRKHPPVAGERQVAALHLVQRNVSALGDLDPMFRETLAQGAPARGHACGRLPDVDEIAPEVQRVDTAGARAYAFREIEQGACFQLLENLFLDAPVEVEFKAVRVIRHDHGIVQGGKHRCPTVTRSQTGLSIVGAGKWAAAKHGGCGRRGWRKLHPGVDQSGVILVHTLTEATGDDATTGLDLLNAVEGALVRVTADARAGYLPRPPAQ